MFPLYVFFLPLLDYQSYTITARTSFIFTYIYQVTILLEFWSQVQEEVQLGMLICREALQRIGRSLIQRILMHK